MHAMQLCVALECMQQGGLLRCGAGNEKPIVRVFTRLTKYSFQCPAMLDPNSMMSVRTRMNRGSKGIPA